MLQRASQEAALLVRTFAQHGRRNSTGQEAREALTGCHTVTLHLPLRVIAKFVMSSLGPYLCTGHDSTISTQKGSWYICRIVLIVVCCSFAMVSRTLRINHTFRPRQYWHVGIPTAHSQSLN